MTARSALGIALVFVWSGACRDPVRENTGSSSAALPRDAATRASPTATRPDATARPSPSPSPSPPSPPTGPTGEIEGVVYLEGPLRPEGPPVAVTEAQGRRPGCANAARRYSQPFDIATPGAFPGVLVAAEPSQRIPTEARDLRITFRDCEISPRIIFATVRDRLILHSETRTAHLPQIPGLGRTIQQVLVPGQEDLVYTVPENQVPARYPITVLGLPEWVRSSIYVLPLRHLTTTDAAGHFRLTRIPVGERAVYAWYPGTESRSDAGGVREAQTRVVVNPGQAAHVEFHLWQRPPAPRPRVAPVDAGEIPP